MVWWLFGVEERFQGPRAPVLAGEVAVVRLRRRWLRSRDGLLALRLGLRLGLLRLLLRRQPARDAHPQGRPHERRQGREVRLGNVAPQRIITAVTLDLVDYPCVSCGSSAQDLFQANHVVARAEPAVRQGVDLELAPLHTVFVDEDVRDGAAVDARHGDGRVDGGLQVPDRVGIRGRVLLPGRERFRGAERPQLRRPVVLFAAGAQPHPDPHAPLHDDASARWVVGLANLFPSLGAPVSHRGESSQSTPKLVSVRRARQAKRDGV